MLFSRELGANDIDSSSCVTQSGFIENQICYIESNIYTSHEEKSLISCLCLLHKPSSLPNSASINPSIQIHSLQDSREPAPRNRAEILRLNIRGDVWSIARILNMKDRLSRTDKRLKSTTFIILNTLLIHLPFHKRQHCTADFPRVLKADSQAARMGFVGQAGPVVNCSAGGEGETVAVVVSIYVIWIDAIAAVECC